MHILLIEDDLDLGQALLQALQQGSFTVQWLRSVDATPPLPDANEVAAVLLDLTLPDGQGMALLRRWRRAGLSLPVIVITARTALQDRLDGLDGGADDYVVKPFALAELLSRIRALRRRSVGMDEQVFEVRGLVLNERSRRVSVYGREIELSPSEFALLAALIRRPDQVQSRHKLEEQVLPGNGRYTSNSLEVHISSLRRQIGEGYVRTVRGVGYVLDRQAYEGMRR